MTRRRMTRRKTRRRKRRARNDDEANLSLSLSILSAQAWFSTLSRLPLLGSVYRFALLGCFPQQDSKYNVPCVSGIDGIELNVGYGNVNVCSRASLPIVEIVVESSIVATYGPSCETAR